MADLTRQRFPQVQSAKETKEEPQQRCARETARGFHHVWTPGGGLHESRGKVFSATLQPGFQRSRTTMPRMRWSRKIEERKLERVPLELQKSEPAWLPFGGSQSLHVT